jgi:predicted nucleic acid-binding protein
MRMQGSMRKLIDCLIAAIAIRTSIPLLHLDNDFEVLTLHTALTIEPP